MRIVPPPAKGCGHEAMSPAPSTSASPTAVSVASHASPGSTVRPLPASHSVLGSDPSPTTTASAAMREPSVSSTASTRSRPRIAATPVPRRRSTPWPRWSSAHHAPRTGPSGVMGVGAMSIIVTSRPSLRAVCATSQPMKPAPTTTRRGRRSSAARSATPSSRLRRTCTPSRSSPAPVQRRALEPGRQDQAVVGHLVAVGEHHAPARAIQARRRDAEPPLHVELVAGELDALDRVLAGQQLLRERRPRVGRVGLVPHDRQLAVEARGARGLRRPQPGERGPDDDDAAHLTGSFPRYKLKSV